MGRANCTNSTWSRCEIFMKMEAERDPLDDAPDHSAVAMDPAPLAKTNTSSSRA